MLTPNSFPVEMRDGYTDMSVYGFKVFGVYDNEISRDNHVKELRKRNKYIEIFSHDVGSLVEFDVDLCDSKRTSQIIYSNDEQEKIANDVLKKPVVEKNGEESKPAKLYTPEELNNIDNDDSDTLNTDTVMIQRITRPTFYCVSFYTPKMFKKTSDDYNGKKIVGHIFHGAFDTQQKAVKYANSIKNNYSPIFTIEFGKWGTIWADYNKNLQAMSMDDLVNRVNILDNYMGEYIRCNNLVTENMEKRKAESLNKADVVTGKYDDMINGRGGDIEEKDMENEIREKLVVINQEKEEMNRRTQMANDDPNVLDRKSVV